VANRRFRHKGPFFCLTSDASLWNHGAHLTHGRGYRAAGRTADDGFGSKCEEHKVSKSSPLYPLSGPHPRYADIARRLVLASRLPSRAAPALNPHSARCLAGAQLPATVAHNICTKPAFRRYGPSGSCRPKILPSKVKGRVLKAAV
jgi:hypothetical protein